jgi:hypothetical protein
MDSLPCGNIYNAVDEAQAVYKNEHSHHQENMRALYFEWGEMLHVTKETASLCGR